MILLGGGLWTPAELDIYAFGETRLSTGNMFTDRLYTGQRWIGDLGIYHFNARFYSPTLGRFLSADTTMSGISNPQNLNRFSYVANNPLRYTDPTGHMICEVCPGEGGDFPNGYGYYPPPPPSSGGSTNTSTGDRSGSSTDGSSNGSNVNDSETYSETDNPLTDIFNKIVDDDVPSLDSNCYTYRGGVIDWTNPSCVDSVSFLTQDVATIFSSLGASVTAATTLLGCVPSNGIGCGAGYLLGVQAHVLFFNPLESVASLASFGLTLYSDYLTHDTSLVDWRVGEDTKTSLVTLAAGSLSVEPFTDAAIDIYASGYNHDYFCGISTVGACIESMMRGSP